MDLLHMLSMLNAYQSMEPAPPQKRYMDINDVGQGGGGAARFWNRNEAAHKQSVADHSADMARNPIAVLARLMGKYGQGR